MLCSVDEMGGEKASLIKDCGVPVDISQALSQMD